MKFNDEDLDVLFKIIRARRDVRGNRFLDKQIEKEELYTILQAALYAPSVGYSQPWKFIVIEDKTTKEKIYQNFIEENQKAKEIFQNKTYNTLKLEGIKEAPINIAVLYDKPKKTTLGMTSQAKMGEYSVVCAVQNMWLMARALNIGIGWVSILDEKKVLKLLGYEEKELIAYLCVGYVEEFLDKPELKTLGWEKTKEFDEVVEFL